MIPVILLTILSGMVIFFFRSAIFEEYHIDLIYILPALLFLPASMLIDGIFTGQKRFDELSVISIFSAVISLAAAYLLISGYGLNGALMSYSFFYFIYFAALAFRLNEYALELDKQIIKDLLRYSVLVGIAGFGTYLYTRACTLILGQFGFIEEIAYFELSDKITAFLAFPFMILGQVLSPKIAELNAAGRANKISDYFRKMLLYLTPLAIVVSGLILLIMPYIIPAFLPKYDVPDFYLTFNLLIINLPFLLVTSAMSQPFIISGGKAIYSLLTIPFGILNIVFSALLIPVIGFTAAIISMIGASVGNKILTYYLVYRQIRKSA